MRVLEIFQILCKGLLAGSKQLTRKESASISGCPEADRRGVSDVSERTDPHSQQGKLRGNEEQTGGHPRTHTHGMSPQTSVSNVWQTPRYQFNSRQYQASKSYSGPLQLNDLPNHDSNKEEQAELADGRGGGEEELGDNRRKQCLSRPQTVM